MVEIVWPLSHNPGLHSPEGTGKLINVFIESRGDGTPVWRRVPGCTVFARAPSSGFANLDFDANARGGQFFSTFFELIGSTTTTFGSTETAEVIYPTGTEAGDVVFILYGGDGVTPATTQAGFTEIATSNAFMATNLMYKVCTGESTMAFVTGAATFPAVALAYTIRGADQTNPICDTGTKTTGATGDPAPGAITCTTADCLIMTVAWVDDDTATSVVGPSTCTVAAATTFGTGGRLFAVSTGGAGNGASVMVAFRPKPTTGAISFSTWAVDTDDEWQANTWTLRHD